MRKDLEHLKLLAIMHYIASGLMVLFSLIPLIYVALGVMVIVAAPPNAGPGPPPAFIGWMFILVGGAFSLMGFASAVVMAIGGRHLARHKGRVFCFIVAGLMCLVGMGSFPLGIPYLIL